MAEKIPIVPDPDTVKPPVMPTIPAPVPVLMPRPGSGAAKKVVPRKIHKQS